MLKMLALQYQVETFLLEKDEIPLPRFMLSSTLMKETLNSPQQDSQLCFIWRDLESEPVTNTVFRNLHPKDSTEMWAFQSCIHLKHNKSTQ